MTFRSVGSGALWKTRAPCHLPAQEIAINADDPFVFASPDGASPRIVTATLRDWTQRLARTTTKTHRASAEDDKRGPRLLLFTRVAMAGGQEAHITVAYDRLASGRLEAVAKLVEGPLLARLRKHFASIATKMP